MYSYEALNQMKVPHLLSIAKKLEIKGRHEMRKANLVEAIVNTQNVSEVHIKEVSNKEAKEDEPQREIKPKSDYVDNIKVDAIIAFKVNESKVISGMVEEIHKTEFVVKTRNGVRFNVRKKNVLWVKTGKRWPRGVYHALKGGLQ
jgi:hypothetical protein